jgi:hypothetical protein
MNAKRRLDALEERARQQWTCPTCSDSGFAPKPRGPADGDIDLGYATFEELQYLRNLRDELRKRSALEEAKR